MNYRILTAALALVVSAGAIGATTAHAVWPVMNDYAAERAAVLPWHAGYYDITYGQPVALVVPPNAETQTQWGWGVGNTRILPIYHQFGRNYPGPYAGSSGGFLPTPAWPSDTTQFGYYYVRGPW